MDERSKLPGYHDEEPGSQAEAEGMGSGLRANRNVEQCVFKLMLIHGRRTGQKDASDPCGGTPGSEAKKTGSKTHLPKQGDNCSWRISICAGFCRMKSGGERGKPLPIQMISTPLAGDNPGTDIQSCPVLKEL